ncbi:GNAT family N-acetyltransferase [Serinibacter salmoneus]|uniref:GNAT family N-acetyltransferase n=1 Tax=Serinibacter salmoneus TaxID=556530 RepID=UPI001B80D856|nr:GNAT family N-acetyltransferase [Serinibacter salmoneus]
MSEHVPAPVRRRASAPVRETVHPGTPVARARTEEIPTTERAFFVEEFRGSTVVVALPEVEAEGVAALRRSVEGFAAGDTRFVVVLPDADAVAVLLDALATTAVGVESMAATSWDEAALARLWVAAQDEPVLLIDASTAPAVKNAPVPDGAGVPDGDGVPASAAHPGERVAAVCGQVAAGLRASKVMLTDPGGGLGDPARSFVELGHSRAALEADLAARGSAHLLPAAEQALRGGAFSVNLCRAADLEVELFTFDGAGTLLTLGGYTALSPLRVDDLPAVESLVAQGVADGILKPRSREAIARIAATGLGARLRSTGHLAGVVGLETTPYAAQRVGEISGLITVSQFSGAGSGGMLIDGVLQLAAERGLRAVFAVTVSDEAAAFFLRRGFHEVPQSQIPPAKWEGYAPERLALARCYWREVTAITDSAASPAADRLR